MTTIFFTDGEFKYEFHQKVYLMDDGSYQVKLPFVGRQSRESESAYQKDYVNMQFKRRTHYSQNRLTSSRMHIVFQFTNLRVVSGTMFYYLMKVEYSKNQKNIYILE